VPSCPDLNVAATVLTNAQLIFGVNFNETRLVKAALESFYGVGPQISQRLMARLSIHHTARLQALGHRTVNDLSAELQGLTIENNLRRQMQDNIKRLREMGTYRGRRHAMGLPVRGQNTRTQVRRLFITHPS
jgi:small subunit ribosomal protein S13